METFGKLAEFWIFIERQAFAKEHLRKTLGQKKIELLLDRGVIWVDYNTYHFCFVGVVSLLDEIFVILPKVFEFKNLEMTAIRDLVMSLRRYSNSNYINHDGIDFFATDPQDENCSRLAIAEFLINDFQANGLYVQTKNLIKRVGLGEVCWSDTIMDIQPIFSQGKPLYDETLNTHTEIEQEHLLTELHKWSLNYAMQYLPLLSYSTFELPFIVKDNLVAFEGKERLILLINLQLAGTYSDRGVRLLHCFKFLISSCFTAQTQGLSLFGTFRFEYVWEDICRKLFNCDKEKILTSKANALKFPIWNFSDGTLNKGQLSVRPDILVMNQQKDRLYILDAKYYNFKWPDMSGAPEGSSVLKQFFYDTYFSNAIGIPETINAFLLPAQGEQFSLLEKNFGVALQALLIYTGEITFDFYPDKSIRIIFMSIEKALRRYNNGQVCFSLLENI